MIFSAIVSGEATNKQEDRNREKGAAGGRKSGFTTDNKRGFEPPSTGDLQVRNVRLHGFVFKDPR